MADTPGTTYYAFNPGLFSDASCYTYREVQRVCVQLGLPARGARSELVRRLMDWHTARENPHAIQSGNFAVVQVNVRGRSGARRASSSLSSSSTSAADEAEDPHEEPLNEPGFSDDSFSREPSPAGGDENCSPACIISPSLLRPFEKVKAATPSRSILRRDSFGVDSRKPIAKCSFGPGTPGGASARKKRERLAFSPYNQVKVIRNRHDVSVSPIKSYFDDEV